MWLIWWASVVLILAVVLMSRGAKACTLSWDTNTEIDMDRYEVVVQQMGAEVFFDPAVVHDPAQVRTEVVVTPGDPAVACQEPAVYRVFAVDLGGNKSLPGELQLDNPPGVPGALELSP